MKRGFTILLLLTLLVTPLVLSQDNLTEPAKEQLSALRGGLNDDTDNILEKQITIPEVFGTPLTLILGIEEDATWQQFIIVLGIFIGFFTIILSVASFMPFFKEGWIKALASLIITILASITGALDTTANFFFNIAGFFEWTASWGPLRMIIAIGFAAVTIYALNKVSNRVKHKMKIQKAGETAKNLKEGSESAETFSKVQKKIAES